MTARLAAHGGRPVDAAIALIIGVGFCLEGTIGKDAAGPPAANVAVGAAVGVALLWRRRAPIVPALAVAAAVAVHTQLLTPVGGLISMMLVLIVVGYAASRYGEGRERWAALAVVALAVPVSDIGSGNTIDDVLFAVIVVAVAAVAGQAVRRSAREARLLAERTHELEAERARGEHSAVLDERRRIARDLHDVVAHTVSVMVVQAGAARRTLERDPARALEALHAVRSTGDEAVAELDRLLGLLRPEEARVASTHPGVGTLDGLAERMRAAGLAVELVVHGRARELDPGLDLAAYRVVQEALTNTLKHAGGAPATVAVTWEHDALELLVVDEGRDGAPGQGSRRGLQGMRERIEAYEGELEAGPAPGGGFRVWARLPLRLEREVQPA